MNSWAEYRHFEYLLAVVERGGLRAAAEQLRTAESNLSVQAKQFQEYFSIELFRKTKDGRIQLTETGIAFKPIAQGLLDARDEAIAALKAIERGQIRTLKMGCTPFVDPELFEMACALHKEILPGCPIRPTHGDAVQLAEELVLGEMDAAIMTLPISDPHLLKEALRQDRLVACLRADDPLAGKAAILPADLKSNLGVLRHPRQHPEAHSWLLALLEEAGVQLKEFSRASHPVEMQALVKAGCGLALLREGTILAAGLTTRPIVGVNWTVETAFVYNKQLHPKTIPVLARNLKRRLATQPVKGRSSEAMDDRTPRSGSAKHPPRSERGGQGEYPRWRRA
jgi:DNA-binding transcriptional LysR family regulator